MSDKKHIAILESTSKVGQEAIEIIKSNPNHFVIEVLSSQTDADLLIEQAIELKPNHVVIGNEDLYQKVDDILWEHDIKSYTGNDALKQIVEMNSINLVFTALSGLDVVPPTLSAINSGKTVAVANKESLSAAGSLITSLAQSKAVNLLPTDEVHGSLFQCLLGDFDNTIEFVYLTYSFDKVETPEEVEELLKTVQRIIEMRWMFGIPSQKIKLLHHPEAQMKSAVQFEDGSLKAQIGENKALQFAFSYPKRLKTDSSRFNFLAHPNLSFKPADLKTFKILTLAMEVNDKGGNAACILNAALELCSQAFLAARIDFARMTEIVESCIQKVTFVQQPSYEDIVDTDKATRLLAQELI